MSNNLKLIDNNQLDVKSGEVAAVSLQYKVIRSCEFGEQYPIQSFFRSDFRGSKFNQVKFITAKLNRSDFVDCVFTDCEFDTTTMTPGGVHNSYFKDTSFKNTKWESVFFSDNTFINCTFSKNTFEKCNFFNCSFDNCEFEADTFVMNSCSQMSFTKCEIVDVDLSNMSAMDYKFVETLFSNVVIDLDYLGTYLFDSGIPNFKTRYRGELLSIEDKAQAYQSLLEHLKQVGRVTEFLNLKILLSKSLGDISVIDYDSFYSLLNNLMEGADKRLLPKRIDTFFDTVEFYVKHGLLGIQQVSEIASAVEDFCISSVIKSNISIEMLLRYRLERIKSAYNGQNIDFTELTNFHLESKVDLELVTNLESKSEAKQFYDVMLVALNLNNEHFQLEALEFGSWKIKISTTLFFALVSAKIIAETTNVALQLYIDIAASKKKYELIENSKNVAELQSALDLSSKATFESRGNKELEEFSSSVDKIKISTAK